MQLALATSIRTTATTTTARENELIDEVLTYEKQPFKRIPGTVDNPVEYFQVLSKTSLFGKSKSMNNLEGEAGLSTGVEGAWGKATTNIDVSADRCLAYFWNHMSFESNARFQEKNGRLLKMLVVEPDSHSMFTVTSLKMGFPGVSNRVFPTRWQWRLEENDDFVAGFTFKGEPPPSRVSEASAKKS
jgi:hypothetical protein